MKQKILFENVYLNINNDEEVSENNMNVFVGMGRRPLSYHGGSILLATASSFQYAVNYQEYYYCFLVLS